MSVEQSLFQALAVLGSTPDEVADRLYEMGFRGRPNVYTDCPLARYLKETLHYRWVGVSTLEIEISSGVLFHTPHVCGEFVELFDAGKWPLLVEEARHAPDCPNLPDDCRCSG